VETHLSEGQCLKEKVNMLKSRIFQIGTRMPTVWITLGQHLVPLNTFIKKSASKWWRLLCNVSKFNLSSKL
jgi:hypothetical protein